MSVRLSVNSNNNYVLDYGQYIINYERPLCENGMSKTELEL